MGLEHLKFRIVVIITAERKKNFLALFLAQEFLEGKFLRKLVFFSGQGGEKLPESGLRTPCTDPVANLFCAE